MVMASIEEMKKNDFRSGDGGGGAKVTPADRGPSVKAMECRYKLRCDYGTYYWTHMWSFRKFLTSMSFTNCALGNKKEVTRADTMGG